MGGRLRQFVTMVQAQPLVQLEMSWEVLARACSMTLESWKKLVDELVELRSQVSANHHRQRSTRSPDLQSPGWRALPWVWWCWLCLLVVGWCDD
jgi:hypothetical protein